MRLFLVDHVLPTDADYASNPRFQECRRLIVELIFRHLSDDPALFGMRDIGEGSESPVPTDLRYGEVETVRIADTATLRTVLRECGDPYSGKWMLIRSLVTCRAVKYGYDGQAFVCLPTDAPPMVSPDETLVVVEDISQRLTETDWMDGLVGN